MKIAVLGGRFDPPHLGHLKIAKEVLKKYPDLKIIFVPVFQHNWSTSVATETQRQEMLKSIVPSGMEVSDIEIKRKGKSYTIDTIKELRKSGAEVFWIVGTDVLPTFHKWKDAEKLPTLATFLVYPRPGYPMPDELPQGFEKIDSPELSDISSTQIRELVKRGKSIKELVPEEVEKYIIKHSLYE